MVVAKEVNSMEGLSRREVRHDLGCPLSCHLPSFYTSAADMMVEVISKRAHAMGVIVPSNCSDQEHSQGGRGVIPVAARFAQGFVDHKYYIDFNNDYFLDSSFGWVTIVHDCYPHVVKAISAFSRHRDFELVKDHRVQCDPNGFWWRRLGVKLDFKEGGMLGAMNLARPRPSLQLLKRCGQKGRVSSIPVDHGTNGGGYKLLPLPRVLPLYLQFM